MLLLTPYIITKNIADGISTLEITVYGGNSPALDSD